MSDVLTCMWGMVLGRVVVYFAAASMHGVFGQGFQQLISFRAKQRPEWAGGLERHSLQAIFRTGWEARVALTLARAFFVPVQIVIW